MCPVLKYMVAIIERIMTIIHHNVTTNGNAQGCGMHLNERWIPFCPVWMYLLNELVFNLRFNCNIRVSSSYCSCRLIVFLIDCICIIFRGILQIWCRIVLATVVGLSDTCSSKWYTAQVFTYSLWMIHTTLICIRKFAVWIIGILDPQMSNIFNFIHDFMIFHTWLRLS